MSETKIGMRLLTDTLNNGFFFVVRFTSYALLNLFTSLLQQTRGYLGIATCISLLQEQQGLVTTFLCPVS